MIGKQLRKLRRDRALKQADIAALLGISRPAYTYYENDKRQPSAEMLVALADFFQVTLDYLTERTFHSGATPKHETAESLLLNRYRYVDKRGKEAIYDSALYEYHIRQLALGKTDETYDYIADEWARDS